MTVINKLNQTLEMIKMSEANCKTFSMDTDDQNAKQMFKQLSQQLQQCEQLLQSRINFVISQEPQYQQQQPKPMMNTMNNNNLNNNNMQ